MSLKTKWPQKIWAQVARVVSVFFSTPAEMDPRVFMEMMAARPLMASRSVWISRPLVLSPIIVAPL